MGAVPGTLRLMSYSEGPLRPTCQLGFGALGLVGALCDFDLTNDSPLASLVTLKVDEKSQLGF